MLELGQIIHDTAAEESRAIGQRGLVDDDLSPLGFDTLHDALDGAVAEVVGIRLHS